ncbi:MAG: rfaE bifunctional protein nucleotidyltransferase chain/domain [Arenicella sp.]
MNTQKKIVTLESLAAMLSNLARPLVFTNGCFDILHRGHTTYLEQSRNLGEALIVGINSDASVKRQNKGVDRPINTLQDRLSVLASLECVDAVVSFDEDTPLNLIMQVMPNHLVKGGDWHVNDIVGADIVQQNGGEVHSLAFEFNRSTSSLINRIRDN